MARHLTAASGAGQLGGAGDIREVTSAASRERHVLAGRAESCRRCERRENLIADNPSTELDFDRRIGPGDERRLSDHKVAVRVRHDRLGYDREAAHELHLGDATIGAQARCRPPNVPMSEPAAGGNGSPPHAITNDDISAGIR